MSLWFIPTTAVAAGVGLAAALVALDQRIPEWRGWPLIFSGGPESARNLLSTIAAAMVTSISLIFSVTMVVLQLASAQYSPRVLRTFLRDRLVQSVLGSYLATFVYSLLVLPSVTSARDGDEAFVPALAVSTAIVLALVSLALFVKYIDHIAHAIRAASVLTAVGDETRRALDHLYPDEIGDDAEADPEPSLGEPSQTVSSVERGVVVTVDDDRLLALARDGDLVVRVVPFVGEFVPEGAPLYEVWAHDGATVDVDGLRECLAFAQERTMDQDAAFGFRQIVDIAERALSPGVNDPTTASQAIDQIHDLLRRLARRRVPSPFRVDDDGNLRVIAMRLSWDDYVALAFDEIRLYSARSIQVVRRLRGALADLVEAAPPPRRPSLERQLRLVEATTKREFEDAPDRARAREGSNLS